MSVEPLSTWHRMVEARDMHELDNLLAEDVVFHSPVVHTPQAGKRVTAQYLRAALQVFSSPSFRYVREVCGHRDAILEFEMELGGIYINGVDMIRWNEDQRIVEFKVMLRPLKALQTIQEYMAQALKPNLS